MARGVQKHVFIKLKEIRFCQTHPNKQPLWPLRKDCRPIRLYHSRFMRIWGFSLYAQTRRMKRERRLLLAFFSIVNVNASVGGVLWQRWQLRLQLLMGTALQITSDKDGLLKLVIERERKIKTLYKQQLRSEIYRSLTTSPTQTDKSLAQVCKCPYSIAVIGVLGCHTVSVSALVFVHGKNNKERLAGGCYYSAKCLRSSLSIILSPNQTGCIHYN